jgi:hypothetical protein
MTPLPCRGLSLKHTVYAQARIDTPFFFFNIAFYISLCILPEAAKANTEIATYGTTLPMFIFYPFIAYFANHALAHWILGFWCQTRGKRQRCSTKALSICLFEGKWPAEPAQMPLLLSGLMCACKSKGYKLISADELSLNTPTKGFQKPKMQVFWQEWRPGVCVEEKRPTSHCY